VALVDDLGRENGSCTRSIACICTIGTSSNILCTYIYVLFFICVFARAYLRWISFRVRENVRRTLRARKISLAKISLYRVHMRQALDLHFDLSYLWHEMQDGIRQWSQSLDVKLPGGEENANRYEWYDACLRYSISATVQNTQKKKQRKETDNSRFDTAQFRSQRPLIKISIVPGFIGAAFRGRISPSRRSCLSRRFCDANAILALIKSQINVAVSDRNAARTRYLSRSRLMTNSERVLPHIFTSEPAALSFLPFLVVGRACTVMQM